MNEQNNYYYIIAYFFYESNSYKQKILLYNINTYAKRNDYINELLLNQMENSGIWPNPKYDFHNKGLSCEYMQSSGDDVYNYLVCFFIINNGNKISLTNHYFDISLTSITISHKFILLKINTNYIKIFLHKRIHLVNLYSPP